MIVKARLLRDSKELGKVPNDKPGWYRWWADEMALKNLLGDHFAGLSPGLTKGTGPDLDGLSCLYVGVAIKESIRARLNWHINQKHSRSSVKHVTLSTLRQSIASLVGVDQGDEAATNQLIDLLTVEYHAVDSPIKSPAAKKHIEEMELSEIKTHILPLNIKSNKRPEIAAFKKHLKAARKMAKQEYFKNQQ